MAANSPTWRGVAVGVCSGQQADRAIKCAFTADTAASAQARTPVATIGGSFPLAFSEAILKQDHFRGFPRACLISVKSFKRNWTSASLVPHLRCHAGSFVMVNTGLPKRQSSTGSSAV